MTVTAIWSLRPSAANCRDSLNWRLKPKLMTAKRIGRHSTRSTGLRKLRDSRNRSSLSKANKNIPALEEWDFRDCKVPENELLECYIHEFSRERISRNLS